jgi:hypothetical protein
MILKVETEDLIDSCPIWRADYERLGNNPTPFYRRIFRLRERWSHELVTIGAPINRLPVCDLQTSLQSMASHMCQSEAFWKVLGPPALLVDLRGSNDGKHLPWSCGRSIEEISESFPLELYLCQHEIRGD